MELPKIIEEMKIKNYLVASLPAEERDQQIWILEKSTLDSGIEYGRRFHIYSKKLKEFSTTGDVKGIKVVATNHAQQFIFNAEFSSLKIQPIYEWMRQITHQ